VGIAAAAFVAIFALDLPFPAIVLAAALIGLRRRRRAPQVFAARRRARQAQASYGPALIDDDTPTPPHARFSARDAAPGAWSGLALWAVGDGAADAATLGRRAC
jgi:chromate transporter